MDSNLGWKGGEKYVATVPQVFDLWQDPQERYDIFMNNYTERTWMGVVMGEEINKLMKTYVQYPPRKLQSADLHRSHHAFELPEVRVASGSAKEGRLQPSAANRQLAIRFARPGEFPGAV